MVQRVALITGCSDPNGFGAHLALELHARGFRTCATARNLVSLSHLEASGCDVLELDVTNSGSIQTARRQVEELTGRLDVLINNASLFGLGPTLDLDLDRFRTVLETNVIGLLAVTQAFVDLLVSSSGSGPTKGRSVVVNVCSSAAELGTAWEAAYGSSKAAAQIVSDHLRREMMNLNVRVITLEIGVMKSRMSKRSDMFELSTRETKYYPNWPAIAAQNLEDQMKRMGSFEEPRQVAIASVDAITRPNSPGRLWLGSNTWLFKWVWPYLSTWMTDWLVAKVFRTNQVKSLPAHRD